ncbi:hypothetical protein CHH34_01550 [Aeromonas veronii]|nr:hypothetical protein CHF44_00490 [Aeromonas veronii]RDU94226.1 hypothetical protein CHH34_01550 [Aeromonas veronii]TEY69168.1 hypothetical protein CIG15_00490 [Aeromonas veronii]
MQVNKLAKNFGVLLVLSGIYFLIAYVLESKFFDQVEVEKEINTGFMSLQQYVNSINGLIDNASHFSFFSFIGFWIVVGIALKVFNGKNPSVTPSVIKKLTRWCGVIVVIVGHFIWNAAANFNFGYMWKDGLPKEPVAVGEYLAEVNYVVDSMHTVVGAASYSYVTCLVMILLFSRVR